MFHISGQNKQESNTDYLCAKNFENDDFQIFPELLYPQP